MIVVFSLACLLACYAGVDLALRRGALSRRPRLFGGLAAALVAVAPFWSWESIVGGAELRWFGAGVATFLSWNAATRDHDPVAPGPAGWLRVSLLVSAVLGAFTPACLLVCAALLSGKFHFWQHHAAFPLRVLQAVAAFVVLCAASGVLPTSWGVRVLVASLPAALALFLTTLMLSHYVITALAKAYLGPRPWSWVLENRLHYLPASAYSWGWARFVSWTTYRRLVEAVRRVERPLQALVFSLELLAPLALIDQRLAIGFCLAFAAFHAGVFLLSGLFFWDWILVDLALALFFARLPPEVAQAAFGLSPFLVGCVVLAIFPLRHRLWTPMPLGWFDAPFTQRVHWRVTGVSGRVYGLRNDFMCPHERLYGKVHGCFAIRHRVLTYHLGQTYKLPLRDALVEAGPSLEKLELVRERYGIEPRSPELTLRHRHYLQAFFSALNRGAKKAALPGWARWLKAPGDQLFYWGDLPRYRRQEPVRSVLLSYREEFFDGRNLVRLLDEELLAFDVPAVATEVTSEMSPREMDDYLLGLALGRLIDLPGFGRKLVGGDDQAGARPVPPAPARVSRRAT